MKHVVLLFLVFISILTQSANGQSISLFAIDTTAYPTIKAKFYAFDKAGKSISLNSSELKVIENGTQQTITNVICPAPMSANVLSSVIVIDVSGSMSVAQFGTPTIDIAKAAARTWITAQPQAESECAITSFDVINYLNQDFSTDRTKLSNALNSLLPKNGTDYDAAMINPMAGGLQISATGKYKKVVLLISDGLPQNVPHTLQIIEEAKKQDCAIYCVTIGLRSPQCMKDMSLQTGGQYFDNIKSAQEAENVILKIMSIATGGGPCIIEWTSAARCAAGYTSAELTWESQKSVVQYPSPKKSIAKLVPTPAYATFKNGQQGVPASTTITLTAQNADFDVTSVISSNPAFTISPTSFKLRKGESTPLTVTFTPKDSSYVFGKFTLVNNLCPLDLFASSGFVGKKPIVSTIKITSPLGGESYIAGSDTLITWEGIPATDSVVIEYSIDNGADWKTLTTTATNLNYLWKNIPKPASTMCKIRIRQAQLTANTNAIDTLGLTLGDGHGRSLVDLAFWSPDGTKVATADNAGKVILWDGTTGRPFISFIGHTKVINSITWSPDGFKVATASDDNTVKIWDATAGKLLLTLDDQWGVALKAVWSPDGSKIVTLSGESGNLALKAKIWDANTGAMLFDLNKNVAPRPITLGNYITFVSWSPDGLKIALAIGSRDAEIWEAASGKYLFSLYHENSITDIEWSPDATKVVSASYDRTSKIWNAGNGTLLYTLTGHTGIISTAQWSPDGSRVATAGADCTTRIWDASTGKQLVSFCILYDLDITNNDVRAMAWSPDGSQIATVSNENNAFLWDATTGAMLFHFIGPFNSISWNPDGYRVVMSMDNTAKIWDAMTGNLIYDLRGHGGAVDHAAWSPDGAKIVAASQYNFPIVWDAKYGRVLSVLNDKNKFLSYSRWCDATFSPDGSKIATSLDNTAKIWNTETGNLLFTLPTHKDNIRTVEWSPDGLKVTTASDDKTARIYDAAKGKLQFELNGHTGEVHSAVWSPDGLKVATASADKTAKIWDARNGTLLYSLQVHTKDVISITWSPDGSKVATASADNNAMIWDATKGDLTAVLEGHTKAVNAVIWSPDGSKVATIGADSTLVIWKSTIGFPLFTLKGHKNVINDVSWSPDGSMIATASSDKTARIWDVSQGKLLYTLVGHSGAVNTVEWSPDGSKIVTGSDDNTIKIWNLKSLSIVQEAISPVFSVVAPGGAAHDIDLKQCLVGNVKDTLVQAYIQNTGSYPLRIDSLQVTGSDASQFSIVTGMPPFEIPVSGAQTVEFRFRPESAGVKSALLLLYAQATTLRQTIRGEGLAAPITVAGQMLDFGKVPLTTTKELHDSIEIKNVSTTPLTITATRFAGPNDHDFATVNGGGSFVIQPNSTAKVDLKYMPSELGRTSGRVMFEYNGIGSPATVQLFGEGVSLTDIPSKESDDQELPNTTFLSVHPNPAQNILHIRYWLPEKLACRLEILSLTGQVVQTIINSGAQQEGIYTQTQDLSLFGSGVYVLRLTTTKGTYCTRVDVVR